MASQTQGREPTRSSTAAGGLDTEQADPGVPDRPNPDRPNPDRPSPDPVPGQIPTGQIPAGQIAAGPIPAGPIPAGSIPPGELPSAGPVPPAGPIPSLGPLPAAGTIPTSVKGIPTATVARLPVYLRALASLAAQGIDTISSGALAEAAGVSSAQLRKDLSYLGSYGTRGVGYDVEYLRFQIGREVGSAHDWPVIIVGLGNLGTALANYSGFSSRGFRVVALVDSSPDLVGRRIHGLAIADLAELEQLVADTGAAIAVIATPAEAAQAVADRLVECGITSILNFAPVVLNVSERVNVRKVDLGQELQILAYHEQRKGEPGRRSSPPVTAGANVMRRNVS